MMERGSILLVVSFNKEGLCCINKKTAKGVFD
jgi:hypothetical protein